MKIKVREKSFAEVSKLPSKNRFQPVKQSRLLSLLVKTISAGELKEVAFEVNKTGMEKLDDSTPCLYFCNHSSFIDLKIAFTVLYPKPFSIVCTSDGFVGKTFLMKHLGCIPTQKFVRDVSLVKNMHTCLHKLKSSVLMYPEASYTFDGTATPLPDSLGKCVKLLGVPVVMMRTHGAFLRDPLYNNLQLRKTKVSLDMTYLLSPEDIKAKSVEEINSILAQAFTFDNFKEQQDTKTKIAEGFRAEGLHRVLYKCPCCHAEGKMESSGITLHCKACDASWELDEYGYLQLKDKTKSLDPSFMHIPSWYTWQREMVKKEILEEKYNLDIDVKILCLKDFKAVYDIGTGRLVHNKQGFHLTGADGALDFHVAPKASYSIYSDYFWYEIGDMICVGDNDVLYYCFPIQEGDVVAKTRLATEEIYKIVTE